MPIKANAHQNPDISFQSIEIIWPIKANAHFLVSELNGHNSGLCVGTITCVRIYFAQNEVQQDTNFA